ncbi:DUF427 domain-containing protein [Amycolatopsis pithecellobii]|uniref:DUF427 domain-containing protein n=1 Tax=Amycolatopsis pithecellobii TaxID=664692 RepID=A0A6N7Z455_9PSEU|nr:DUF427 domain-containing protein [Amycolatopsis pithecellobii]MTD53906.1 DUF427 domain-containing protein [Amycolatopsis pithecellobii]
MTRTVKIPDETHPITVEPTEGRVVVRAGGKVIAESTSALTLREANYPPVQYIPLSDVDPSVLRSSDTTTYCPYKGDAGYYSVVVAEQELTDAVWTYEQPYDAVANIASHVAFYPDKVEITVES